MKFSVTLIVLILSALAFSSAWMAVEAKTGAQVKCSSGYAPAVATCKLPSVSGTPVTGSDTCCSCPFGSFSDGTTCRACTNGLTAQSGVDLQKWGAQCSCLPGFGDYDSNTMTCRRCPINTYSSNNQCVPCAVGTFAAAQSSACAAAVCPADSYLPAGGATVADCTRCKFGTAGQSCSDVQGCRCLPGYASFDKTSGQCQQCPSNAIAIYADMTKQDETATVCAACPTGTLANDDKRTCAAPTTVVTKGPVTAIVASSTSSSSVYPSSPIPALKCAAPTCSNGYDVTVSFINSQDSTQSTSATVSHTTDFNHASSTAKATSTPAASLPGKTFPIVIADADTNLLFALLIVSPTGLTLYSQNSFGFFRIQGRTCDAFQKTASAIGSYYAPCVTIKKGSTPTSIVKQLQAQKADIILKGWDLVVSATCATDAPLIPSCSNSNYGLAFYDFSAHVDSWLGPFTDIASSNASPLTVAMSGTGASKFASQGVAVVDYNYIVQYVITAPQITSAAASSLNAFFNVKHPAVGKKCEVSKVIAACFQPSVQGTSLNAVMNSVVPGAIADGNVNKLYAFCDSRG